MTKVALVVGHTEASPGATNGFYNVDEFSVNSMLVSKVVEALSASGVEAEVVYRGSYKDLPGLVNSLAPSLVVSFHCNAFNTIASGTEVLYYKGSHLGQQCALMMQGHLVDALQLPDRGIKFKSRGDRGGLLLQKTRAPCVIIEPFFIDNNYDYMVALRNIDTLASNIALGIEEIFDVVL